MATRGIIFGDTFLPEKEFIEIFEAIYGGRRLGYFIKDLRAFLSNSGARDYNTSGTQAALYKEWEEIQKKYFGNSAVEIVGAVQSFNGNVYHFTEVIPESSIVDSNVISPITTAKLKKYLLNKAEQKRKAQRLQFLLQDHLKQMRTAATTILTAEHNKRMSDEHARQYYTEIIEEEHYTGGTIFNLIYKNSGGGEGKFIDAYLNHIGLAHPEIIQALRSLKSAKYAVLKNYSFDDAFDPSDKNLWDLMLESTNTTPWYKGGDMVTINDKNIITSNIQIKSSQSGNAKWSVANTELDEAASAILKAADAEKKVEVKKIARLIYEKFSIEISDEAKEIDDKMLEDIKRYIEESFRKNAQKKIQLL